MADEHRSENDKDCPKCGNVVEGQAVGSDGFFLTYICDECGFNLDDCKHKKDNWKCEGCPNE
jgi:ribosomal protein L37AE/L43A